MDASTTCVWAGDQKPAAYGALTQPISLAVTNGDTSYEAMVARSNHDHWREHEHEHDPESESKMEKLHGYMRKTNPTVDYVCEKVLALEKGDPKLHAVTAFPCGMSAIYGVLASLLTLGDRVVSIKDIYGGTMKHLKKTLPEAGREVTLCETDDADTLEKEILKGCQMVYLESPTNPLLKIVDLERMVAAAHRVGAIIVIDSTFATPMNQQPLSLGFDLVVHSATKYLNGHGDTMGGFVIGRKELVKTIWKFREVTTMLPPQSAYLIARGIRTLSLRVKQHNKNAMAVAQLLSRHPWVKQVNYPGLTTHPNHEIAKKQMIGGFGGIVSFELHGGKEEMKTFLDSLRFAYFGASLGHVETLVGTPAATSHIAYSPKERAEMGISETLIRYSTGIEETEDLLADLTQALAKLGPMTMAMTMTTPTTTTTTAK